MQDKHRFITQMDYFVCAGEKPQTFFAVQNIFAVPGKFKVVETKKKSGKKHSLSPVVTGEGEKVSGI